MLDLVRLRERFADRLHPRRPCRETHGSDSWIFEEVVKEDEDGTSALVRVSQNGSYQPVQKWPEQGQVLVVANFESNNRKDRR